MKILVAHNYYVQPGGEDTVFRMEADLLLRAGHEVHTHAVSNKDIPEGGTLGVARRSIWNEHSRRDIMRLVEEHSIDVVHFHNTFPLLSPSVFHGARRAGAAVVVSLHNPRIMCPSANFYRDGGTCMDCLGKNFAWPGVMHACYRNSRPQTAINAGVSSIHRALGTWQHAVDRYIVFTEYFRDLFVRGGLPPEKLMIKPHFVDVGRHGRSDHAGSFALFVGRLDPEKGVRTLLRGFEQAHAGVAHKDRLPLYVRGEGQLEAEVASYFDDGRIRGEWVPRMEPDDLYGLMQEARCLIWPSEGSYETFGLVAAEAMACGTPVVASDSGVGPYVVPEGLGGVHFPAGNASELAARVREMTVASLDHLIGMRTRARRFSLETYSPEANLTRLEGIYEEALDISRATR